MDSFMLQYPYCRPQPLPLLLYYTCQDVPLSPSTLPVVLHFNFIQINIQCLYYMAMQMILMSKRLLFFHAHSFIFHRGFVLFYIYI